MELNWHDYILSEFTPNISRITLVADPDGLLLDEMVLETIKSRGFEILHFVDNVSFRFEYETGFRSKWDKMQKTDLVVILRSHESDLYNLPYDLLQAGRKISFSAAGIFPNLNYRVITSLPRVYFNELLKAVSLSDPGNLGENATKEFILRNVFRLVPEVINSETELLRVLIRRHYQDLQVPPLLDDRFLEVLKQKGIFDEWPLDLIVPKKEDFFGFLQERWPIFLRKKAGIEEDSAGDGKERGGLRYKGPESIPFDDTDIKVYVDTMFTEGALQRVEFDCPDEISNTWIKIGIISDDISEKSARLKKLIKSIRETLPKEDAVYQEWLGFVGKWSELKLLAAQDWGPEKRTDDWDALHEIMSVADSTFSRWIEKRFSGLIQQPTSPPVLVHHIPSWLSKTIINEEGSTEKRKVALIVIDGLSYDIWLILKNILNPLFSKLTYRESAVFSWIPTLTSVSRQAIFAGKTPNQFSESIDKTDKEKTLWERFWDCENMEEGEVFYKKGLGKGNADKDEVGEALSDYRIRVAGLVINKIDDIMHGIELGTAGMQDQARLWAEQGYLKRLIEMLIGRGFEVCITSDHGSVEAEGIGSPGEGSLADTKGERVRVYPSEMFRDNVMKKYGSAVAWVPNGLPENYFPLIAPRREAFIQEKKRSVCHGGISIDEMIVPLITIEGDLG